MALIKRQPNKTAYLGHANISTSMDLYADIFEQSKKDTAKKLDALMNPHFHG